MATSWEEIKRLAADFQRVQLVESSYKLSERNCIEIINKLIGMGKLNVFHTIDGKEFITHKHLEKEIYDELYVHDGRINVVKLQELLNVDVSHIESKVSEIVKRDPNLVLILGQIISKDYMNKISEEINEILQDKGNISISELTNLYELPADFIQQIVKPRVGTIIKGNFDGNMLYTLNYVNTQKALLAGVLEASIKPIRFSQIIKEYNLDGAITFEILDELIASGKLKGSILGGRQALSAVFVPEFFTRAQKQYVDSFLRQNGYIDYSSLKKIGITEPESYIKSLFESQDLQYFSASCFMRFFLDQIEADIEENINRTGICDLSQLLPSSLNSKDLNSLTVFFENKIKSTSMDSLVMADTYLVAKSFLKSLNEKFDAKMEEKSGDDLKKPNYVLAIKSDKAVVAGHGGASTNDSTQTSSKQTKKSKKGAAASAATTADDQDSLFEVQFIDKAGLNKELKSAILDVNDDLVDSLNEHMLKPLNVRYLELLKTKVEKGLITSTKPSKSNPDAGSADSSSSSGNSKKQPTIKDIQERVKIFLLSAKIYEKALKLFSDAKVQDTISKHMVKTDCAEIVNEMVRFIAYEQLIEIKDDNLNSETRGKLIQKFKDPFKKSLAELHQSINNKPYSELVDQIEKVAVETIELSFKKNDQKREKDILLQLREATKQNLENETDQATILHLTLILLFYQSTGLILNCPGRCVPNILEFLKPSLVEDSFKKLFHFQNIIIENATSTTTINGGKLNSNDTGSEGAESSNSNTTSASASATPISTSETEHINEIRSIGLNTKTHLLKKE